MYREVYSHRDGHLAQEQSRHLLTETKAGFVLQTWGFSLFQIQRTLTGGRKRAFSLHPSNLQANELEHKVKCINQAHVALFYETLTK